MNEVNPNGPLMPKKLKKRSSPKDLSDSSKQARTGKRATVFLTGTAKATAAARIEARITDAHYDMDAFEYDIKNKRVWFEAPPDEQGWMKLLYSADGPTGDTFPIGKIRIYLDPKDLDQNFGDLSQLTIKRSE
jgi:hypothetical protein